MRCEHGRFGQRCDSRRSCGVGARQVVVPAAIGVQGRILVPSPGGVWSAKKERLSLRYCLWNSDRMW